MARIEFIKGVQCKQCGYIVGDFDMCTSELCQNCGTHILNIDYAARECEETDNARRIIIKATRRIFRPDIYEFVKEM